MIPPVERLMPRIERVHCHSVVPEGVLDLVSAGVDHGLAVGPGEAHEDAALEPVLAVQDDGLAIVGLLDLKFGPLSKHLSWEIEQ